MNINEIIKNEENKMNDLSFKVEVQKAVLAALKNLTDTDAGDINVPASNGILSVKADTQFAKNTVKNIRVTSEVKPLLMDIFRANCNFSLSVDDIFSKISARGLKNSFDSIKYHIYALHKLNLICRTGYGFYQYNFENKIETDFFISRLNVKTVIMNIFRDNSSKFLSVRDILNDEMIKRTNIGTTAVRYHINSLNNIKFIRRIRQGRYQYNFNNREKITTINEVYDEETK